MITISHILSDKRYGLHGINDFFIIEEVIESKLPRPLNYESPPSSYAAYQRMTVNRAIRRRK
jgi:hypothetical protein